VERSSVGLDGGGGGGGEGGGESDMNKKLFTLFPLSSFTRN